MVAELLTLVNIGDMHLDNGCLQRADAVVQSHRSMCIGTCVEHDTVVCKAHLLHLVDQLTLHIALEILDVHVRIALPQLREVLLEGRRAVDTLFTGSQQVEIRTIND